MCVCAFCVRFMVHEPTPQGNVKHPRKFYRGNIPSRFPGVRAAAAELGVTHGHLHQVLAGKRLGAAQLVAGYRAYCRRHHLTPAS